jgi:hypothetical protein
MIELNIPAKYLPIIEGEAKARSLTVEQLFLTAIADYLPRGAKTAEGRLMPFEVHMRAKERDETVAAAGAAGEPVNTYIKRAVGGRRYSERKQGRPWKKKTQWQKYKEKRAAAQAAAALEAA